MPASDIAITVDNVSKRYGLPIPAWLRRCIGGKELPLALDHLSLEVKQGESLGIIGHNGAGKSTLLKVLAGVTPPTEGSVVVRGRLFPMIELNAGLHMDLNGRENVRLLGSFMGMTQEQMLEKMPSIEGFCQLGEWFERPVRMYSSGMLARLGFGVAMNVDADILLIDEVMAVGDLEFQRKSMSRMLEMHESGATIIFITHNLRLVERLCSRAVCLHHGRLIAEGAPKDVITEYQMNVAMQGKEEDERARFEKNVHALPITLTDVELFNADHERVEQVPTGSALRLRIHYQSKERIEGVSVGVGLISEDNIPLVRVSSEKQLPGLCIEKGEGYVEFFIPNLPILRGVYSINSKWNGPEHVAVASRRNVGQLIVYSPRDMGVAEQQGLIYLPIEWSTPVVTS